MFNECERGKSNKIFAKANANNNNTFQNYKLINLYVFNLFYVLIRVVANVCLANANNKIEFSRMRILTICLI